MTHPADYFDAMSPEQDSDPGATQARRPLLKRIFHPRVTFRVFWALWRVFCYAIAFALHDLPAHSLTVLWGSFLPVEAWAIARTSKGDTLSDTHWFFGMKGWAFRVWGMGHAVLYAYLAAIYPEHSWGIQQSVPWDIFCSGLGGWLIVHFALLGQEG